MRHLAILLSLSFLLPAAAQPVHTRKLAKQSAIVIVMCEDGGKTPAGRAIEDIGQRLLQPFVKPYYSHRTWLKGAEATRKAFLDAVGDAARARPIVDVVLFVHGTKNKTHLADGFLTGKQLAEGLKSRLTGKDVKTTRLRMCYSTACFSTTVLDDWAEVAYAARGMRGINRPLDFPRFYLGWIRGEDYRTANTNGFAMNKRLHERINESRPRILARLREYRDRLGEWKPEDVEQKKLKLTLRGILHIAIAKWLKRDWDVEESRPRIVGGDARIDRPAPAAKPGERKRERVVYY